MPTNHTGGAEHSSEHSGAAKAGDKNILAIFAYLWILILIPFLTDAKNDPFVKYHLKQGLALIIFEVVGWVVSWFLFVIPPLAALVGWLWWLASIILAIIGIVNVLSSHEKELPLIGRYAGKFTF